jgi:phosphoglucosamine mutase
MNKKYFGTDGIRGQVGQPPITPDFVLKLANAVGRVLLQNTLSPTVLVGKDTRLSGYMLESALESGFNSAGVNVVLLGPVPTPAVAYLTPTLRAQLGVVISASHNPFTDNGIKFFNAQGHKLNDAWEEQVESFLNEPCQWADARHIGKSRRLKDGPGRYIEFCKSTFPRECNLEGFKLVVDAAHGAAYQIAPAVFEELGAEVVAIGCAPNGMNINDQVGATSPQTLVAAVLAHKADLGIALDGDADRLQVVDAQGRLFNGDELLYVLVRDRLEKGEKVPGVVGTVMTNMGVECALQKLGVALVRAPVGDRYVLETLQNHGWLLGGEGSGHLLALDKHSTGDGLISALQVLQALVRSGKTLAQWLEEAPLFPQAMVNIPAVPDWESQLAFQTEQAQIQKRLGTEGRVLVRPSGTEPVLRIMVECPDAAFAQEAAQRLAETLSTKF